MRISNNVVNDTSIGQSFQIRTNKAKLVQSNFGAFRVELSQRALMSEEYNSKEKYFPIHNPAAVSYSQQMKITYVN